MTLRRQCKIKKNREYDKRKKYNTKQMQKKSTQMLVNFRQLSAHIRCNRQSVEAAANRKPTQLR